MTTNFQRTADWLRACGKEPGNQAHLSTQIGCHIEEIVEFLRTLRTDKDGYARLLTRTTEDLEWYAGRLKSGESIAFIEPRKRAEALDALCDCEVTGNGVAYLAQMNKPEADQRVLQANDLKLVGGKPVIRPGGKIGKPEGWKPAFMGDLV